MRAGKRGVTTTKAACFDRVMTGSIQAGVNSGRAGTVYKMLDEEECCMARKGTAGRTPEKQLGARESAIDKAINKTKEALDGDNEATDYGEEKGQDQQEDAKEYSKHVSNEDERDVPDNERK